MNRLAIATLILVACVVACDEKKTEAADAGAATSATAAATPASAAPVAAGDTTEEDFEDEAQTSITEANLESELTKLEAEIK